MGYYSFWPNRNQELLLAAALSDPDIAILAWKEWQSQDSFGTTDNGSRRIMPLVYNNLKCTDSVGSTIDEPRDYYRHIRLTNKLLLFRLEEVLALLEYHGIPTLVLKGAALTVGVYRDPGLRPMIDLDIAVPRDCSRRIVGILSEGGWAHSGWPPLASDLDQIRTLRFENSDGVELDLHFALFEEARAWRFMLPFWADAVPLQVGRQSALTLSMTDHLLHVLVHGNRANRTMPPIRWIADAVWLLRGEGAIDWDRIVERSGSLNYQYSLSVTLGYLVDRHNVRVPEKVFLALGKQRNLKSVLCHQMRVHPRFASFMSYPGGIYYRWRRIILHWENYANQHGISGQSPTISGFFEYVRARWSARDLSQTAGLAVRRFLAL